RREASPPRSRRGRPVVVACFLRRDAMAEDAIPDTRPARSRGSEEQRGAPTSMRPTVLVHRQAIYTPQLEGMAYLLDGQHRGAAPGEEPASHTLARGLLTSVLDLGLEALVGPLPAVLPVTPGVLRLGALHALPPGRVVLALPATITAEADLRD